MTPTVEQATAYLGQTSWDAPSIAEAYASEKAAQARVCRIPQTDGADDYPPDLVEALYRRVAHNLALRALPLGVATSITEQAVATNKVGGTDAEVRRLEGPYRKMVLG